MITNLVKKIIENGGEIKPLILPYELAKGTGQMNPSILVDGDKMYINIRNVQYVIIHSENEQKFQSRWGPLTYVHPENDRTLRTFNFLMEVDDDLNIKWTSEIDFSKLNVTPVWEFIGLEDVRLVKWNDKFWACGVRRDTDPTGKGRMEMSEIVIDGQTAKEVSRHRIEPAGDSYCEKNWMPILDKPNQFVKWTNPTEIVKVDLGQLKAHQVFHSEEQWPGLRDMRGGSQVIPFGENYLAVIHEVVLFKSKQGGKDAYYYHRFIVWDKDFKIIKMSDCFDFLESRIEFTCGLAIKGDMVYLPFGAQDNAAYILKFPVSLLNTIIYG